MDTIQSIATLLVGGGLFGFIEFLLHRKDEKEDKNSEVLTAIQNLEDKINELNEKIDKVDANVDEGAAVTSRVRLLRFSDELRMKVKHSKDAWDQCFSDITTYEHYCASHPDFKNNQTEATVEFIHKTYKERLEQNDFL